MRDDRAPDLERRCRFCVWLIVHNIDKGGADSAAIINKTESVQDYVSRPHHEGATCINLRSIDIIYIIFY